MSQDPFERLENWIPQGGDKHDGESHAGAATLSEKPFHYIGRGYALRPFRQYVAAYDFGSIKPDSIVLHHTAIPSASWARYPRGAQWDAREQGLSIRAIYFKRQKQLAAIRDYYASKGWDSGPHLFIDDLWIWLFTPLYDVGTHARGGNSWRIDGKLHYSIGIEVVGYYEHRVWPAAVARLVGGAVAALHARLGTFAIEHRPGPGGISSHRDYNKPSCPGKAITESYYLNVIRGAIDGNQ